MLNVMLDIETMSNTPNAAIVSIGAVEFDFVTKRLGEEFYVTIDLASAVGSGGEMNGSTVVWWLKQTEAARSLFFEPSQHIVDALNQFSVWMQHRGDKGDIRVWGNGAAFDNVILVAAYNRLGLEPPWKFWNDRCYRTIKNMFPKIKAERVGTHHHALDDARTQAKHLIELSGNVQSMRWA